MLAAERIDRRFNQAAVEKKASSSNSNSIGHQPRVLRSKQAGEKLEGFGGDEFATNFVTGKAVRVRVIARERHSERQ